MRIKKRIIAIITCLCLLLGMNTSVMASSQGKDSEYSVDMVIVMDISNLVADEEFTKLKDSIKTMAESMWKEEGTYNININIALISYGLTADNYKHNKEDFYRKEDKDEFLNVIDSLDITYRRFTQGGIYEARKLFEKSNADKKIMVLLSDGVPNRIYEPIIDIDDYMTNNKKILEGSFYYEKTGIDVSSEKAIYCALVEARLVESENTDLLNIYTVAVDCNDQAKEFLREIASDKEKFKEARIDDLEDSFKYLVDDIKNLLEKEKLENEKDKSSLKKMNIPKGISENQWYPEDLVSNPRKTVYNDGEKINLEGMKVKFSRVIKENGRYVKQSEDIDYDVFKNGHRGWEFSLGATKASYSKAINGKLKIGFKFSLKNQEKPW